MVIGETCDEMDTLPDRTYLEVGTTRQCKCMAGDPVGDPPVTPYTWACTTPLDGMAHTRTLDGAIAPKSGVVFWGVTTAEDATLDTGSEVCATNGFTCVTTNDVLATPIACGTAHTDHDYWLAFCR